MLIKLDHVVLLVVFFLDWSMCAKYHSNDEIFGFMKNFSSDSSLPTRIFQIGKSVSGIRLNVLEINLPGRRLGTPNIKYIANIHGNEAVGREVLLHFMKYLDHQYKSDKLAKCLLDNVRVYILPTMNPDGFNEAKKGDCDGVVGRHNKNDFDLNRNFPDYFHGNSYGVLQDDYQKMIQPETAAIMKWMNETTFVLSASLHGGAMVANYPFDTFRGPNDQNNKGEALTPDSDIVYDMAKTYANLHKRMSKGVKCPQDQFGLWYFRDGLTNGARWYDLRGGMQDYNYAKEGCIELTFEISCCKYPLENRLPQLIEENMKPLLRYGLYALKGIRGMVLDSKTRKPLAGAVLRIVGRKIPFKTSRNGEFWRVLKAGKYNLRVEASGYISVTRSINVKDYPVNKCPKLEMIYIYLEPKKLRKINS